MRYEPPGRAVGPEQVCDAEIIPERARVGNDFDEGSRQPCEAPVDRAKWRSSAVVVVGNDYFRRCLRGSEATEDRRLGDRFDLNIYPVAAGATRSLQPLKLFAYRTVKQSARLGAAAGCDGRRPPQAREQLMQVRFEVCPILQVVEPELVTDLEACDAGCLCFHCCECGASQGYKDAGS